ncbi:MAG TPA: methyltransferase domain-containing protein [Flavobacteriales bacterium]|nr:methyltransferase domain-containing protein [Flavobacteriales bacterium]HRE96039.1 methyltransferase domain-containing protein [Flavobacteriales bacterium]HRJ39617.1 methyltransferase domain-containing protein [Flavobacteriales bacterium]
MKTKQTDFWSGEFGKEYTDRNSYSDESWDDFYRANWGATKTEMNEECLEGISKEARILEVGCNMGLQLRGFQRMGFTKLYGIELQQYAVNRAHEWLKDVNIIQGSGFDIPFRDGFFDVVCTNGVLIHIAPSDYDKIMGEMYRCSARYIMGFEYYSDSLIEIPYRGNKGYLWKADFAAEFIKRFPDLKLVRRKLYPYFNQAESGNTDYTYLLEKTK